MRYHLLETVRQYAREKLNDSGESLPLHDRHAAYYLDLAAQCEDIIHSLQAADWLRRMDADFANIRAALGWALDGPARRRRSARCRR